METQIIRDRGRGPEIAGTRITVYNLLPHFMDATATEDYVCRLYDLTPDMVAAARAYVLNNPETVLAEHLKIEARIAAGNPPQVAERAQRIHATFMSFRQWLAERDEVVASESPAGSEGTGSAPGQFATFREWLAGRELHPVKGR